MSNRCLHVHPYLASLQWLGVCWRVIVTVMRLACMPSHCGACFAPGSRHNCGTCRMMWRHPLRAVLRLVVVQVAWTPPAAPATAYSASCEAGTCRSPAPSVPSLKAKVCCQHFASVAQCVVTYLQFTTSHLPSRAWSPHALCGQLNRVYFLLTMPHKTMGFCTGCHTAPGRWSAGPLMAY
jgi:hypothetical protein